MYIARILYPVKVLGPGNRVGIWFNGCKHQCPGCSNPELWNIQERYRTNIRVVKRLLDKIADGNEIEGFTLTGGDPFLQPDTLRELLPVLKAYSHDVLAYTGYEYGDIANQYPDIVSQLAVVIDGRYVQELNNGSPLKGSDNQTIVVVNENFKGRYDNYLCNLTNEIQNFTLHDGVVSVGIHRPGYEKELDSILIGKGLK